MKTGFLALATVLFAPALAWAVSAELQIEGVAGACAVDVFRRDAVVFSDRTYRLAEPPATLRERSFVRMPIDGTKRIVCRTGGEVSMLTPQRVQQATSLEEHLVRSGFVRDEKVPLFSLFGTNEHEKVNLFCKQVRAGESFLLGKWAVLVNVGKVEVIGSEASSWERAKNDGERLYNGIVLPKNWPPRNIDLSRREVQRVPYLDNRPEIVDIDVGRQLFVDDFLVEKSSFLRMYKLPRKHPGNPVLRPESPLDAPEGTQGGVSRPCVWFVPSRGVYRMWYVAGTYYKGTVCVAESKDGLHWTRPSFDVNPGTNQSWPMGFQTDSWSVAPDPFAPVGSNRWKLFATNPGELDPAWCFDSPDGIHWGRQTRTGKTEDRATMFYNPFRRKWVYSIKGSCRGRVRKYHECADFLKGADWDFATTPWWTGADREDSVEPGYGHAPQLYNLDAVAYESLMLGFFEIHRGPENHICEPRGLPKLNEITFAYSRDGFHWHRPDRRAHLSASRTDTWDRGFIETCGNCCVIVGDELWFFHSGCRGDWNLRTEPKWLNMYDRNAIGVSVLRRDGFCALNAGGRMESLTTRPVRFSGRYLFVNADVAAGELLVEVLDRDGRVIPGFEREACRPVSADSTRAAIRWTKDLSSVTGRPVRFRFHMRRGDLYSFWVSKNEKGASGGWLAGGGVGYASWRDE